MTVNATPKPPPADLTLTCAAWIALFTELDRAEVPSTGRLAEIASEGVRFRDPFNDLRGVESLRRLLLHTKERLPGAQFRVWDTAWSGSTAYLKWRMTARVRLLGDWRVEGMSEVRFGPDGRVEEHLDYWDAAGQFYGRLPLIGPLLRLLARPATATKQRP
jgi:steroid delta-isomerase